MKIYNKKDFLKLPSGTFFAKGVRWSIDGFCIKGQSLGDIDFFYTNLVSIEFIGYSELVDRQEEMLNDGTSYPLELNEMRDGCFCEQDIFLVFENSDLKIIKNLIEIRGLKGGCI